MVLASGRPNKVFVADGLLDAEEVVDDDVQDLNECKSKVAIVRKVSRQSSHYLCFCKDISH